MAASAATRRAMLEPRKSGKPCDMLSMPGLAARALSFSHVLAALPPLCASAKARLERRDDMERERDSRARDMLIAVVAASDRATHVIIACRI